MVKLERFYAFVVATPATLTAFVLHGHQPNLSVPLANSSDHIGSAICVSPLLHHFSRPVHSQPLYQLSYRGIHLVVNVCRFSRHPSTPYVWRVRHAWWRKLSYRGIGVLYSSEESVG